MPTPPANNPTTTFQVGTYNSLTDTFTEVLDLNDFNTFWIEVHSMKMPQPEKVDVRSFNVRTPGESIYRVQYKNRHLQVSVRLKNTSTQAILNSIRTLLSAIESPPYTIRLAQPGATQYSYFDVLAVKHNIPSDPQTLRALIIPSIQIDFECKPGIRGDRVYLQNLLNNPGFEAPSGSAVQAFNDSFANGYAYYPTQYDQAVLADSPIRYYKLQEGNGTLAADAGVQGVAATYTGGFTLQENGPMNGGSVGVSLNGTSGYLSVPTTGLPSGASAVTMEAWIFVSSVPSSTQMICNLGNGTSGQNLMLQLTSTGHLQIITASSSVTSASAITANAWHHVVGYYDGTNIGAYLDGSSIGTPVAVSENTTYGAATFGARENGTQFFLAGEIAFCALYSTALSSGRVTAHYNAGNPVALSLASNLLTIPANARVAFGSPAWGAINLWSIRFKWVTSLSAAFYLHWTDSNDYLVVVINGSTIALQQTIGGVTNTIQSTTASLTNGNFYWMQATQFPNVSAQTVAVTSTVYNDSAGALGSSIATASGATHDGVTALVGRPQIGATGASLIIGGAFSNVHTVSLFGPGAWIRTEGGTGVTAMAWDGAVPQNGMSGTGGANTYPNGPVTSFGALRGDFVPGPGTINFQPTNFNSGTPTNFFPMPVKTAGDVLYLSVWGMSSGLGPNAQWQMKIAEYNAAGSFLRSTNVATNSGNLPTWTQFTGSVTTGASCAYAALFLSLIDSTAGDCAGGTVWFDNCQVWDATTTGETTMPYCELRFPQSPGMLITSGLLGDIPAPAVMLFGAYVASLSTGHNMSAYIGRRAQPTSTIRMVMPSTASNNCALDANAYGGYHALANVGVFYSSSQNESGTFHFLARAETGNASPSNNVWIAMQILMIQGALQPVATETNVPASWQGPQIYPFSVQNTWSNCDLGQLILPIAPTGALSDPTQISSYITSTSGATVSGSSQLTVNTMALLPVDGEVFLAYIQNLASISNAISTEWIWLYWDGLTPTTTYSAETVALANPAHGIANPQGTAQLSTPSGNIELIVTANADTMPQVDPTTDTSLATGVNQYLAHMLDDVSTVLPIAVDIVYSPLYLYPR